MAQPCKAAAEGGIGMKKYTIEQALIAARPTATPPSDFVQATMQAVKSSKNPEIISGVMRRMGEPETKGWSFMKKLQTLPLVALVLLALGGAVLLGGATYAAYKFLWEPLRVTQSSVTTDGDENRVAFDLSGCVGYQGTPEAQAMVKSKIDDGVSTEEAEKYVGAYCERNVIHQYGYSLVNANTDMEKSESEILLDYEPMAFGNVSSLTDGATRYIVAGMESTVDEFDDSDLIFRIMKTDYQPSDNGEGPYENATLLAVVKASYETKYYDPNQAMEVGVVHYTPCLNNVEELCINGPGGLPVYRALPDTAGPDYPLTPAEQRLIDAIQKGQLTRFEGDIVDISGDTFTIKTTTGRLMTVQLPSGTVEKVTEVYKDLDRKFEVGGKLHLSTISTDRENIKPQDLVDVSLPL